MMFAPIRLLMAELFCFELWFESHLAYGKHQYLCCFTISDDLTSALDLIYKLSSVSV